MLLLPGPGLVTIAIGLAILSAEFVWARRWLERMKRHVGTTRDLVRGRWKGVSLRGKVAQKVRGE
jgi:tellurite resistance protein TerC